MKNWLDKQIILMIYPERFRRIHVIPDKESRDAKMEELRQYRGLKRHRYGMVFLDLLLMLGFMDKPQGEIFSFHHWRWDFWNSECHMSIWSACPNCTLEFKDILATMKGK